MLAQQWLYETGMPPNAPVFTSAKLAELTALAQAWTAGTRPTAAQLQTWDAIRDKFAKEDAFFAKVVESQRAYAANVVPGRMAMYPAYSFSADYYWRPKPGAKPNAK